MLDGAGTGQPVEVCAGFGHLRGAGLPAGHPGHGGLFQRRRADGSGVLLDAESALRLGVSAGGDLVHLCRAARGAGAHRDGIWSSGGVLSAVPGSAGTDPHPPLQRKTGPAQPGDPVRVLCVLSGAYAPVVPDPADDTGLTVHYHEEKDGISRVPIRQ